MGLNIKKILAIGGGIAATVATGGISTALIPAVFGIASELAPDGTDKDAALDDWERAMILEWVDMYRHFMNIEMSPESKQRTTMGKLRSDFIMKYADMPKERWVEYTHSMLVMAVKGDLAASS